MYYDAEAARSRCLFRPVVWSSRASGDDNRVRRELSDAGLDRPAIGTPPTSDNSDSHVTVPPIHTNADVEVPRLRSAVNDSSMCQPDVARSSTRITDETGSAICWSGGSLRNSFG